MGARLKSARDDDLGDEQAEHCSCRALRLLPHRRRSRTRGALGASTGRPHPRPPSSRSPRRHSPARRDCVYVRLGTRRTSRTRALNVTCTGTGRNGVSAVASDDLLVSGGSYSGIGYIAFDAEPNSGSGFGVNGAVFDGATVGSYANTVGTIVGDNRVDNVRFSNLRVTASRGAKFQMGTPSTRSPDEHHLLGDHRLVAERPVLRHPDDGSRRSDRDRKRDRELGRPPHLRGRRDRPGLLRQHARYVLGLLTARQTPRSGRDQADTLDGVCRD
jgi:hypothetical protein